MRTILKNKKATFNYEILEKYSAGISLYGFEVKSLKNKRGSFEGSFISISNNDEKKNLTNKKGLPELFLKNFSVPPYQEKNTPDWYEKDRPRRLLVKRSEIKEIQKKMKSSRLTLIPLSIYLNDRNLLKLEFALVRGKKKHDKRESLKKRDDLRNAQRELKKGF